MKELTGEHYEYIYLRSQPLKNDNALEAQGVRVRCAVKPGFCVEQLHAHHLW